MSNTPFRFVLFVVLTGFITGSFFQIHAAADEKPDQRSHPWTTSNVKGSPDPPLPYKTTQVFTKVKLDRPTNITWLPAAEKWVANHAGGKIVTFGNDPVNAVAQPLLNLGKLYGQPVQTGYATKFHYDLENQPWCFLTFTTKRQLDDGHFFARLKVVDPTVPTFDSESLRVLFRWKSFGHVGSSMQFGPDGMLQAVRQSSSQWSTRNWRSLAFEFEPTGARHVSEKPVVPGRPKLRPISPPGIFRIR